MHQIPPQAKLYLCLNKKERVRDVPVCVVIPPSSFLADERVFPFLGPLKVAAELRANGNPIDVLDLSGIGNFGEAVAVYVKNSTTQVYGLTATTPQLPAAVAVKDTIKTANPNATVILGGPHATMTHTGKTQDQKHGREGRGTTAFNTLTTLFDTIVIGDGERAIFYAIDPEISQHTVDAASRNSNLFMDRGTLDDYQWPARDLIDLDSYKYHILGADGEKYRAFSLIAQLGCPFGCGFCGGRFSRVFRQTRTRSYGNVTAEINHVVQQGWMRGTEYHGTMFYDDELNISPGGLETLASGLIDQEKRLAAEYGSRYPMRYRGFVKGELVTGEQTDLMYKSGFRELLTGIESGSNQILRAMNKGTTKETNSRAVKFAHNSGLRVKALMSLGHPGESAETIAESVEWVKSNLKPGDQVDWTIITKFPGTPYYDEAVPLSDHWVYTVDGHRLYSSEVDYAAQLNFYKGVPGSYSAFVWTDYLTPSQLKTARDNAEKETRDHLGLSPIEAVETSQFDHAMGQQKLPPSILRSANT